MHTRAESWAGCCAERETPGRGIFRTPRHGEVLFGGPARVFRSRREGKRRPVALGVHRHLYAASSPDTVQPETSYDIGVASIISIRIPQLARIVNDSVRRVVLPYLILSSTPSRA